MPPDQNHFVHQLIDWYRKHRRDLPWRQTSDAYKIWLSEIILQQTRVDQGLPYFQRFIERYEDIHQLAAASEQDVLRLWQGLGYYSRARNLHRCAQLVSAEHGGQFPENYDDLLKLPGIGPYTAAAIASIAFGESVAVIDGNVYRVLSRLLGIEDNIAEQTTRKVFQEAAQLLIDGHNPSDFNQAMMEFGALVCLPKNPQCQSCIVQESCYAFKQNAQGRLPVNQKQLRVRERFFNYVVVVSGDQVVVNYRGGKGIWKGLYDFYCMEQDGLLREEEVLSTLSQQLPTNKLLLSTSKDYKHILTHQRIFARFFTIELNDLSFVARLNTSHQLKIIDRSELGAIPKPRLIDRFLADENFL